MASGKQSRAGIVREPTVFTSQYPAGSPAVVAVLLPLLNEDVKQVRNQESVIDRAEDADSFATKLITLGIAVNGGFTANLSYTGLEDLFGCTLGHQAFRRLGAVQPEDVEGGLAFRHLFEMERDLDDTDWLAGDGFIAGDGLIAGAQKIRRLTYAVDKVTSVWSAKSMYIASMNLDFTPQGPSVSVDMVGHSIATDDAVNSQLNTLICNPERVIYQDVRCFLSGSLNSDPNNSLNQLEIVGVALSLDNGLAAIHTRSSRLRISEPRRNGAVVISGTLALPRYSNNEIVDIAYSDGRARLLIEATGPLIPGTSTPYTLRIHLPLIQFTGADVPIDGPGQAGQSYSFIALSTSETTGLPTLSRRGPMVIELINDNAVHTLFP